MNVAGVRLADRSAVWVDAGDTEVSPLDRVVVSIGSGEWAGEVFVAPGQLVREVETVDGVLVSVKAREPSDVGCWDLPGSDLPPLGGTARLAAGEGTVMAIDAVRRRVTILNAGGERHEVSSEDLIDPTGVL